MTDRIRSKLFLWVSLAAVCMAVPLPGSSQQAQAADITGKWHFVFQTQNGTREFDANFQQDGEKVTGRWADSADVKGSFSSGKLSLEFAFNSDEVGPGTLKIDGEFSGDALTGNWSFQTYDGTFKATRSKSAG